MRESYEFITNPEGDGSFFLFKEAGCGFVFQLCDRVERINTKERRASTLPLLPKYFGLNGKRDLMVRGRVERMRMKFQA